MLPEQQQRILGYFLEEARDHLNTIEQGLLNLQSTLNDPEMINEVFRAAHSIKGGAAMLGLNSIQHTAHRLEDCFKVLKDNPVQVDEKLESLFLGVSDTLKVLLEHLGGPFGLSEEAANTLMSETEPVFRWLNEHLELLVEQGTSGVAITVRATEPQLASVSGGTTPTQMFQPQNIPNTEVDTHRPSTETSSNQNWGEFQAAVLQTLREMLQLFKQTTTPLTRQNLQQCCQQLVKLGVAHNLSHWSGLCQAAASAIANPDNSYLTLAKIVITEIKKAQELVLQGREAEIVISPQLNELLSFAEIELLEITPDVVDEEPQAEIEAPSTLEPAIADLQPQNGINNLLDNLNEDTDDLSSDKLEETPVIVLTPITFAAVPLFDHEEETVLSNSSIDTHGPVVGIAELNSLADLFEGDSPELDETWQQEEILDTIAANQLGIGDSDIKDDDNDLAELLSFDDDTSHENRQTTTSITEDLTLLFGENFVDKENSEPQNQPTSATTVEVGEITSSNLDSDSSTVEILEEFTISSSDSQQSPVENDVVEDLLALTLDDNELLPTGEVTPPETENIASLELSSEPQSSFDDLLSETLTLDDNELLPTGEVTPPETENIANIEVSSEPQRSFDDLLSETTNAESLEELTPLQPESLSLDNLFAEIEENTPLPTDESEIGALFDSPKATAAEVSTTSEDELNNFWNQTNEAEPNKSDSLVEQDIARDLEESLFAAAASDDSFADSQQSIPSATASFDLEDFDITFLQPEQPQELIFASDAGDNLFDDLAAGDSTISPAIGDDEVSLQEIRGFSQEPESLDFMPEFTSLAPETTAADSPQASVELEVDLFSAVEDESEENLPLSFDATYIQPELTDSDAGELFGNIIEDESEENLPLSFDSTYIQPELTDSDAGELFGNIIEDESEENLPLSFDSTYIQPELTDSDAGELFGNIIEDESEENLPLSFDSTYIQPELTDSDAGELFGNIIEDESEENLPLSFDSTYIQPELTDSDAGELFGNIIEDESEENLPLSFDATYIQPELTDSDAGELFGNIIEDESEENLPLSFDATYIQPELTDSDAGELFGNIIEDESEENLPLSFDATYIQPELTDSDAGELFGNIIEDESEENLPLSFDATYIQPELTDSDAGELFGNIIEDESEENLPLSFDATYIQPELTDSDAGELFGNIIEDESEENLPLSFDATYIQPELTDSDAGELFGNIIEDESEENLPLSFDATYIQPELTDSDAGELFGNIIEDESEENLPLSFDATYIQPELTDSDAGELFGNIIEDESEENLPLSFDATYIQPELTDSDAGELFGTDTELDVIESTQTHPENVDTTVSDTLADAFEFTEIAVVETAQLSLVNGLLVTETALPEAINEDGLSEKTVDEFVDSLAQEGEVTALDSDLDEFNLEIEQNFAADLSEDLLDLGETENAASVIEGENAIVPPTEELEAETITDVNPDENETDELDEFAELEALLDEELAPITNPTSIPESDFAALEALLGTDNEQETAIPKDKQPSRTQPVLAQPHNAVSSPVEDEFQELEDLLKEAGQTISHTPAVKSTISKTTRPSTRRAARFEETMKVPVKQLDDMSNLVGELVVNRNTLEQDHERLRQSLDNLLIQVQQLSDVGARMQELYERSLLEASLLASRKPKDIGIPVPDANTDRGFSALEMDRFTPFHTLSQEMIEFIVRVRESASDIDFVTEETERVARQFRQVTTQLQEGLTRARMVPFTQAVDSKRRGVRDNAIKCGKQVELVIEGGDTLIDKMILDHLTDPLTHMLNNAIAHGIETPEVRVAAGKSPVGVITIRAFHQGNQTVISVGDDGAGIDPAKVKIKALKTGTITPDQAKTISRLEIYDLLFQPGFSMKDQADEFSGRGVGMDVVRSEISEIRGIVNTDSGIGKGTTFTIRLPLTLSICKALCCVSDKARIAFPMDGVEDTLDIPMKNIQQNAEGQTFIYWRDTALPFRPLKELLTFNRQISRGNVYGGTRDDDMVSVVVVRSGNTMIALQIDQVLSEQEIVIKQFEGPAPKPIGVAGATVLGDGRIMPIADVLEIIDIFQGRMSKQIGGTAWQQKAAPPVPTPAEKIDPTVLIVDDSITVRELLSLTFNKAGYRVEQARDGQEAWDKLRSGLPCDIVFCDIEMPRCDGLELLSRIQKDSNLNHLPIAMLTSRGADRHRQMAVQLGASGYFTKPYLEEALLEAASRMLKGEKLMTTV